MDAMIVEERALQCVRLHETGQIRAVWTKVTSDCLVCLLVFDRFPDLS